VYELCKYSLLSHVLYKVPLDVFEGSSKYKETKRLVEIIIDKANE
jgi:hypothetical protein